MLRGTSKASAMFHGKGCGLDIAAHTGRPLRWEPHLRAEDHLDGARKEAPRQVGEQLGAHLDGAGHVHEGLQLRPGRLQLPLHLLHQLPRVRNGSIGILLTQCHALRWRGYPTAHYMDTAESRVLLLALCDTDQAILKNTMAQGV